MSVGMMYNVDILMPVQCAVLVETFCDNQFGRVITKQITKSVIKDLVSPLLFQQLHIEMTGNYCTGNLDVQILELLFSLKLIVSQNI